VERLKNRLQAENLYLREEIELQHNFEEIIGDSPVMKPCFARWSKLRRPIRPC
jgi:hypothetical protein